MKPNKTVLEKLTLLYDARFSFLSARASQYVAEINDGNDDVLDLLDGTLLAMQELLDQKAKATRLVTMCDNAVQFVKDKNEDNFQIKRRSKK